MKNFLFWGFTVFLIWSGCTGLIGWATNGAHFGGASSAALLGTTAFFWGIAAILIINRRANVRKARAQAEQEKRMLRDALAPSVTDELSGAVPSRAVIRAAVEDAWRCSLNYAARGQVDLAGRTMLDFDAKVKHQATAMPQAQGEAFYATVEEERNRIIAEYDLSPDGLKKRLGVTARGPMPAPVYVGRQGIGEMAVRTAVRATIWATIFDLFRF